MIIKQQEDTLTEMNQKPSISLTLILRHCHDARNIIFLLTMLFFRKIPDEMATLIVIMRENVKKKRFDIVIQRFMIKKQLC